MFGPLLYEYESRKVHLLADETETRDVVLYRWQKLHIGI